MDTRAIPTAIRAGALLALTAVMFGFILGGISGLGPTGPAPVSPASNQVSDLR